MEQHTSIRVGLMHGTMKFKDPREGEQKLRKLVVGVWGIKEGQPEELLEEYPVRVLDEEVSTRTLTYRIVDPPAGEHWMDGMQQLMALSRMIERRFGRAPESMAPLVTDLAATSMWTVRLG